MTYSVAVSCEDADCIGATITDAMPESLAGFAITSITADMPSDQWALETTGRGDGELVSSPDCVISVAFRKSLGDDKYGLAAGQTTKVGITVLIPADLLPSWACNGQRFVNEAAVTWENALPVVGGPIVPGTKTDDAALTIEIPQAIDLTVGKTWEPASQQYEPGAASTITLTAANASNVGATELIIREPALDPASADGLAADNPFRYVDLATIDASLPTGATAVRVDASAFDAATETWGWVTGVDADTAALPAGVDSGAVGGLRFTYTGNVIKPGAAATINLGVAQRANDRVTDEPQHAGVSLTNEMFGELRPATDPSSPVSKTADAPFEIRPLNVEVAGAKSFAPAVVPAGTTSIANLAGSNASNGTLSELTLSEADFFTADVRFGGFSHLVMPQGATAATITWRTLAGDVLDPIEVVLPVMPSPPTDGVSGFDITFTGAIVPGAEARVGAIVAPSVDLFADSTAAQKLTNTLTVTGKNAVGSKTVEAEAPLTVKYPEVGVTLKKQVRPGGAVMAGGTVLSTLTATSVAGDSFVKPTEITVNDGWRTDVATDFWNAFDLTSIAPTQIPSATNVTISVTSGGRTFTIIVSPAREASWTLTVGSELWAQALSYHFLTPADVDGVSFVFENETGFASGVSVIPQLSFTARAENRDGTGATSKPAARMLASVMGRALRPLLSSTARRCPPSSR